MENNKLYEKISKEILLGICTPYRSDNPYDDQGIEYTWKYNNYGLCIISKNIDETEGKLRNLIIYYEKKEVYNKEKDIYIPGIWEEILKELDNKLPILIQKEKDRKKRQEHCQELLDKLILPITREKTKEMQPYLKPYEVKTYTELTSRTNNCGGYMDDYYFEVKKSGETMFKAVSESMFGSDCKVWVYKPGIWEFELEVLYRGYQKEKEIRKEEKGKEYLKQIRNIK